MLIELIIGAGAKTWAKAKAGVWAGTKVWLSLIGALPTFCKVQDLAIWLGRWVDSKDKQ